MKKTEELVLAAGLVGGMFLYVNLPGILSGSYEHDMKRALADTTYIATVQNEKCWVYEFDSRIEAKPVKKQFPVSHYYLDEDKDGIFDKQIVTGIPLRPMGPPPIIALQINTNNK